MPHHAFGQTHAHVQHRRSNACGARPVGHKVVDGFVRVGEGISLRDVRDRLEDRSDDPRQAPGQQLRAGCVTGLGQCDDLGELPCEAVGGTQQQTTVAPSTLLEPPRVVTFRTPNEEDAALSSDN